MPTLRLIAPLIALVIMIAIACTPEYEKVTISIPIGLAVGFMVTRWYVDQPRRRVGEWWRWAARQPRVAYGLPLGLTVLLGLLPVVVRGGMPLAKSHDEFSILLAADTYLHGRWVNPTPAGWEHFESVHINVVPAYCSKYQPGMGLMLAMGRLLGHPYLGMLLAMGLASLSTTWMFRAWLPVVWALSASLLVACIITTSWSDGYFAGGPLALAAGAVLVRYFLTARECALRSLDALLLTFCLVTFFWTRPFEGGIAAALLGVPILVFAVRLQGWSVVRLVPVALLVLLPVGWMQLSLNQAATGSYTRLPYVEHEAQYGMTPLFLVTPPRENVPAFRHVELKRFQESMFSWYQMQRSPNWLRAMLFKLGTGWNFFFSLLWLLPLATLPEWWRMRPVRYLFLCWMGLYVVLTFGTTWFLNHYAAPLVPAWAVVVMTSCRLVSRFQFRGYPWGRFIVILLMLTTAVQAVMERNLVTYYDRDGWAAVRQQKERQLATGKHLVFMTYGPKHDTGQEWVYNSSEINNQAVIWVRSMGADADRHLMKLYPGRQYWQLQADSTQTPVAGELREYGR